MTVRDLKSKVSVKTTLAPVVRVNGTFTGNAVDLRGYDSALLVVAVGAYTDGSHAIAVEHSVDGATYAACATSDLDGTFSSIASSAKANTVQSVGYIGSQRFVRISMTVTGATSGASSVGLVLAGHPRSMPA